MPMIKCPECGRDISSYAPVCPGCGVPQEIIKQLLAEQEKSKMQTEPAVESVQEEKPVQKATLKEETVLKKTWIRTTIAIHCVICKKEYMSDGTATCPKCKYPTLSVIRNKQRTKEGIEAYRKEAGIQDIDLKVGQFFKMGHSGGEEINWRVLAVENGKALLISEKGLDAKKYHSTLEDITWEECDLRKWLNSEFLNSTFTDEERTRIQKSKVTADINPEYSTNPGKDTEDHIFLLSIPEAKKYFKYDEERKAYPSETARNNGAYVDDSTKCCWWWLRSPGLSSSHAAGVSAYGSVLCRGGRVDDGFVCVRPALWVHL